MSKWKKIFLWLVRILLIGYTVLILALTLPGILGLQIETVTSGSMMPSIPTGAVVYVKATSFEQILPGTVITFYLDEHLTKVTHRVVSVNKTSRSVQTKGDANDETDAGDVLYENILGRVVFSLPYLGYIALLLSSVKGKILLLGAAFLIYGAEWGLNFRIQEGL